MVFFNKNMNYSSGQGIDERSTKLAQLGPQAIKYLAVRQTDEVLQKRAKFLERLEQTTFSEDRCSGLRVHSKYGAERGRFLSFGLTQSRKSQSTREADGLLTRQDENTNNSTHRHLYGELLDYMDWHAPGVFSEEADSKFNSCIIAKDSQCEWHHDKNNVGPAALTAQALTARRSGSSSSNEPSAHRLTDSFRCYPGRRSSMLRRSVELAT
jgi:hypothetical protein